MPKFLATSIVLAAFLAGCVSDPVTGERRFSVVNWSAEEELELGREFAPNIESQFDAVYPDAEANELLRGIVAGMVELSPRRDDFEFRFKILNSSIPNAFALPGGFVYITRGLLQELETEGQFVSVLGHELGHVEHRHAMLNQSQSSILGFPSRTLDAVARRLPVGGGAASLATSLVGAPSALLGLKFSRDQELEADVRGVFFADELRYDPRDAIKTFELFKRMEEEAGGSDFAIFRTHPLNDDRIEGVEDAIQERRDEQAARPGSFRETSDGFEDVLRRFRERAPAYALYDDAVALLAEGADLDQAARKLREAQKLAPDEPLFSILAGEIALLQEDAEGALEHFATAIGLYARLSPNDSHWKPHMYVGVFALEARDGGVAVTQLETAAARFPMNATAHLFLGDAYALSGDAGRAKRSYERAMELSPKSSEVHEAARRKLRAL